EVGLSTPFCPKFPIHLSIFLTPFVPFSHRSCPIFSARLSTFLAHRFYIFAYSENIRLTKGNQSDGSGYFFGTGRVSADSSDAAQTGAVGERAAPSACQPHFYSGGTGAGGGRTAAWTALR